MRLSSQQMPKNTIASLAGGLTSKRGALPKKLPGIASRELEAYLSKDGEDCTAGIRRYGRNAPNGRRFNL